MKHYSKVDRRNFVSTTASLSAAIAFGAPGILTASKTDKQLIIGEGDYRYEVQHNWPKLPDKYSWQTTHNVAVDKAGNLYVIHEGRYDQKDHLSIFVFDPEGKFIRAFGQQFQGGGHGLEVREEDGTEYLYVSGYQQIKAIAKLDLKGETVWHKRAPMESKLYAKGEDTNNKKDWGRNRFMPTNFAFLPDGDFFLTDGYGSYCIHRYDKDGNWKSKFGGPGKGEGTFNLPHGLWVDSRKKEHELVVTDRAHHTVQFLTLDGKHLRTMKGFGLPANIDTFENQLLIPELHARITILNENNEVVARLGDDVARIKSDKGIRGDEKKWLDGKFVHPHDACFDAQGNIIVAEWVHSGRITMLKRV